MSQNKVELKGNLLIFSYDQELTTADCEAMFAEARKHLKNAPKDLRVVYDGRHLSKVGMPEAMAHRKFISEEVSSKVVKGAGIAPNTFVGFLGKVAFAASGNHKVFYSEDYAKAMDWVKS